MSAWGGSNHHIAAFGVAAMSVLFFLLFGVAASDASLEAEMQIAELKAIIAHLEDELLECREGRMCGGPSVCLE